MEEDKDTAGVPAATAPSTMGADQVWGARRLSDRKPAHGVAPGEAPSCPKFDCCQAKTQAHDMRGLSCSDFGCAGPAGVAPAPVADAETKAAYVAALGSDKGWLGIEGGYFIEGYREGKRAAGMLEVEAPSTSKPVAYADRITFESAMKAGKGCDVWPTAGDYTERTGRELIALYASAVPASKQPGIYEDDGGPIHAGWQLTIGPGHSGYGIYAHVTEYPDEGAVCLAVFDPKEYPDTSLGVPMGDCGNAECNWRGPISECSYIGTVGPCCPQCREIVEPDALGVAPVDERQEFETWAAHEERLNLTQAQGTDGSRCYSDKRTMAAWHAWQAARGVNAPDGGQKNG